MSIKSKMVAMAMMFGGLGAFAQSPNDEFEFTNHRKDNFFNDAPHKKSDTYSKQPLTKKQKRLRVKNKMARKSRKINFPKK